MAHSLRTIQTETIVPRRLVLNLLSESFAVINETIEPTISLVMKIFSLKQRVKFQVAIDSQPVHKIYEASDGLATYLNHVRT